MLHIFRAVSQTSDSAGVGIAPEMCANWGAMCPAYDALQDLVQLCSVSEESCYYHTKGPNIVQHHAQVLLKQDLGLGIYLFLTGQTICNNFLTLQGL